MDILQNPIIVAALSLLVVPGVVSLITAWLRRASDDGIKPQAILYIVSAVLVAIAMFTSGAALPGFDFSDPAGSIMLWQAFTVAFAGYTGVLYDVLLKRFWSAPEPAPEPAPDQPTKISTPTK